MRLLLTCKEIPWKLFKTCEVESHLSVYPQLRKKSAMLINLKISKNGFHFIMKVLYFNLKIVSVGEDVITGRNQNIIFKIATGSYTIFRKDK